MTTLAWGVKYRPKSLKGLIGNERVKALDLEHLSKRLLITGETGAGKTTLADILAKHFTGAKSIEVIPNLHRINVGSENGIDRIRDLLNITSYAPLTGKAHVVIMDEAHAMTKAAVNALLTPLESPSETVVWIFCTNKAYNLPAELISRLNRIDMQYPSTDEVIDYLDWVVGKEGLEQDISIDNLTKLVQLGGTTNLRLLLNALQDMANGTSVVSALRKNADSANLGMVEMLVEHLVNGPVAVDVMAVYKTWTTLLVNEIVARNKMPQLTSIPPSFLDKMFTRKVAKIDTVHLSKLATRLNRARTQVIMGGVDGVSAFIHAY